MAPGFVLTLGININLLSRVTAFLRIVIRKFVYFSFSGESKYKQKEKHQEDKSNDASIDFHSPNG